MIINSHGKHAYPSAPILPWKHRIALYCLIAVLLVPLFSSCTLIPVSPEPTIDPDQPLSVGSFIWLLLKETDPQAGSLSSIDKAVDIASTRGYITAGTDPDDPMTREVCAHILMNVLGEKHSINPDHYRWQIFDLSEASSRFSEDILNAYAHGLMDTENALILPKNTLVLAEAEKMMPRLTNPEARLNPLDIPPPLFEYKGLVEIAAMDPTILIDLKYATTDNFTGVSHYEVPLCLLEIETAYKLLRACEKFRVDGYALKIWDGYRPVEVQWSLHNATPDHLKQYVPAPSKYSQHAKGIAVDITLVNQNLQEIPMPTGFDDFSEKAHADFSDLSQNVLENRSYLIDTMNSVGFTVSNLEWWHFWNPEKSSLAVSDVDLSDFIEARNQFYLEKIQFHSSTVD